MPLALRPAAATDAAAAGEICYDAFRTISERHGFPPDFPSVTVAVELMNLALASPNVYGVVAEVDGQIVGSNFLWTVGAVGGVGPITVRPRVQNGAIGRQLMGAVLKRARVQRLSSVRLVQAAFHTRSMSLYTKLGFVCREPLALMQGVPPRVQVEGYIVRAASEADLEAMNTVCRRIHGHDRDEEVRVAIAQRIAMVVEHAGRVTGYAAGISFFGHAMGETTEDLKALIAAAPEYAGPGFLLPTRNAELFRWCLENGLRMVQPMTLMSTGLYNEPAGAFLPSILF